MTPTFGDIEELRAALLAAKRGNDFGRGAPDAKLQQIEPLISALQRSISLNQDAMDLYTDFLYCVRKIPVYPRESDMGSDPLVERWVVANGARFDAWVERARAMFPKVER